MVKFKVMASARLQRVARQKRRSSQHGTCEGVPLGTGIPVGQVQTYAGPFDPAWGCGLLLVFHQVGLSSIQACRELGLVKLSQTPPLLMVLFLPNLWQTSNPQGSLNLGAGMCLVPGLGVCEKLGLAETWTLASASASYPQC